MLRSLGLRDDTVRLASARAARGALFSEARQVATPLSPPLRLAATIGARAAAAAAGAALVQPHHLLLALCALEPSSVPVLHALLPWRDAAFAAASAAIERGALSLKPLRSGQSTQAAGAAMLAAAAGAASAARLNRVVSAAVVAANERKALTSAASAALAAAGDEAQVAGVPAANATAGHLLASLLREMADPPAAGQLPVDGAGPVLQAAGLRRSVLQRALRHAASAQRAELPVAAPSPVAQLLLRGGGGAGTLSPVLSRLVSAAAAEAAGAGGSPLYHPAGATGTVHLLAALFADADSADELESLLEGAQPRVLNTLLRHAAGAPPDAPLSELGAAVSALYRASFTPKQASADAAPALRRRAAGAPIGRAGGTWPLALCAWYARHLGRAATADEGAWATFASTSPERPPCVPVDVATAYRKGFTSWSAFMAPAVQTASPRITSSDEWYGAFGDDVDALTDEAGGVGEVHEPPRPRARRSGYGARNGPSVTHNSSLRDADAVARGR